MNKLPYILSLILISLNLQSAILEVGSDKAYKKITEALALAEMGDTILVHEGMYREGSIDIRTSVHIQGVNDPVIDGENKYEILRIWADSVVVRGITLKDVGVSYVEDRSAIRLIKNKYCVIESNHLVNAFFGIYLEHCRNIIIRNNIVQGEAVHEMNSGNAIHLWYCKDIIIEGNYAEGHRDGIYLEFVDNSTVKDNTVFNNLRYGLHFMYSDNDRYLNNRFEKNGAGVAVMFSKYILMQNNVFINNWGSTAYGLLLKEITDSEIAFNTFEQNTTGIYGEGVNRVSIHNNDLVRNGWAMNILGSCADNQVYTNNFLYNSFDVSTNSSRNYNNYDGNFWSDNTNAYDLDRDGICDIPYRPVKLFSYMIGYMQSSTILMRSLLIDLVNYAEKVAPVITPHNLIDNKPLMSRIEHDRDTEIK
jgi:nitrous oxidase accessory protein